MKDICVVLTWSFLISDCHLQLKLFILFFYNFCEMT